MKKLKVLSALMCAAAFCASIMPVAAYAAQPSDTRGHTYSSSYEIYRLYNPNSGEHFYTSDKIERQNVIAAGWNDEGIGWDAPLPTGSSKWVYRLYNKNGGEHHYTLDTKEKESLVRAGWTDEGVCWDSSETNAVPVYRLYNPNAFANNHHYTTNKAEKEHLVSLGWKDEGIGWYGVHQQRIQIKITIDDDGDPKTTNVEKTVKVNADASVLDALQYAGAKVETKDISYGSGYYVISSINGVKSPDENGWYLKFNDETAWTSGWNSGSSGFMMELKPNDHLLFSPTEY